MSTKKTTYDPSDLPGAVSALAADYDNRQAKASAAVADTTATGHTFTAANSLGKTVLRSGAAGVSDTTPTAALIVAALGAGVAVGDVARMTIRNKNTGTLTLVAGSGVTLEGVTTVAQDFSREYLFRVTNIGSGTEAVTLSGISTAAV